MTPHKSARPSPLHVYIGLEDGRPCVFVSSQKLHKLSPMHWRDTEPPGLDPQDILGALRAIEKYFEKK